MSRKIDVKCDSHWPRRRWGKRRVGRWLFWRSIALAVESRVDGKKEHDRVWIAIAGESDGFYRDEIPQLIDLLAKGLERGLPGLRLVALRDDSGEGFSALAVPPWAGFVLLDMLREFIEVPEPVMARQGVYR